MKNVTESDIRAACMPATSPGQGYRGNIPNAQPELSVEGILEEIQRIADLPLAQCTTLPSQAYTSNEFFEWEVDNIFRNDWYAVAHISQLPENGDFINLDLFGEPMIAVKDKEGQYRILSRVCPHRAMDIMPPGFGHDGHSPAEVRDGESGCGKTRFFLCPYHFWTFELNGQLKACAEMGEAEDFNRDDWKLREFRSEIWNGFLFLNLDGKAPQSVAEKYAALNESIASWKIGDMKLISSSEWDCAFNWKVLTENFMESYHHAGAHSKTLQPMMPARDTWTEEEKPSHIRCHLPMKPALCEEIKSLEADGKRWDTFPPVEGLNEEERFEWGLGLGFPLFTFVTTPDCFIWYRIEPLGPDRLKLLTTILVPASTLEHSEFESMKEKGTQAAIDFHLEDMEVCMAVQRGLYTSGYQRGRLSHLEMPIWLIQRFLAARARGTWPTLDRPAAPAQLQHKQK